MKHHSILLLFFLVACDPMSKTYQKESSIKDLTEICSKDPVACKQINYAIANQETANVSIEGISYKDLSTKGEYLISQEELRLKRIRERIELLNSIATVKVYQFWLEKKGYQDYQAMTVFVHNSYSQEIKAMKGEIIVEDLFGDHIRTFEVKIEENISPNLPENAGFNFTQFYTYNSYISDHSKIKDSDPSKFKIKWNPIKIILSDGSVIE